MNTVSTTTNESKILIALRTIAIVIFSFSACIQSFAQTSIQEGIHSLVFDATNTLSEERKQEVIYFTAQQLGKKISVDDPLVVMLGDIPLKHQWVTKGGIDSVLVLAVQSSFSAKQTQTIKIFKLLNGQTSFSASKNAYAELAVRIGGSPDDKGHFAGGKYIQMQSYQLPSDHTIGNKLFKYEGFGWESDLVGYRYYFDNRGAVDIFGKQTRSIVLPQVGLDGTDYHTLNDWGMDVLKVGGSLGIGAVSAFHANDIVKLSNFEKARVNIHNGQVLAGVEMQVDNWKIGAEKHDLSLQYRIAGGSRLTEVIASSKQGLANWATGIVNHSVDKINNENSTGGANQYCYRATYGAQSLNDDNLGMAIFYPCTQLSQFIDSDLNIGVALQTTHLHYYFMAAWQAEAPQFANKEGFVKHLKTVQLRLNNPIELVQAK